MENLNHSLLKMKSRETEYSDDVIHRLNVGAAPQTVKSGSAARTL